MAKERQQVAENLKWRLSDIFESVEEWNKTYDEVGKDIQDYFPLGLTGLFPLLSRGLSRILSSTSIQKHQVFIALWFNFHICTRPLEKP